MTESEQSIMHGTTSQKFDSSDADVVIRSSDDVLFHLHKRNLEFATGGFPFADMPTANEVVPLTESAKTLEVLFQFVYPQRYPQLEDTPFEELLPLAEAAEKYEVYAAISVCLSRMKEFLRSDHSKEILNFAARHNYPSLVGQLAPTFVDMPLAEIVTILPQHLYVPWSIYREQWLLALRTATSLELIFEHDSCSHWRGHRMTVIRHLGRGPSSLKKENIASLFKGLRKENVFNPHYHHSCSMCVKQVSNWERNINQLVAAIPPFTFRKDHRQQNPYKNNSAISHATRYLTFV